MRIVFLAKTQSFNAFGSLVSVHPQAKSDQPDLCCAELAYHRVHLL